MSNERDTIGGVENVDPWGLSPLAELQRRVDKLEESLALAAELVQGLVRRVERLEERSAVDPEEDEDSDLEDDDEDEEDEDE